MKFKDLRTDDVFTTINGTKKFIKINASEAKELNSTHVVPVPENCLVIIVL